MPKKRGVSYDSTTIPIPAKAEYHFTEGPAYLRANGVLDESDPEDPKVSQPGNNREESQGRPAGPMKYRKFHKDMEWMMFVKSMLIKWFYLLEALHSTVLLGNCCVLIWPHATRGIFGYLVLLMRRAQMGKCDLQVLIPNYLASPSNCVQPAGILAAQDAPAQKWMPILRRCFIDVPSWSKLCFNWFVLFVSPVIHVYALLTGKFG